MMPGLSQQIMGQGSSVIATPGPSGLATPGPSSMSTPAPLVMPGILRPGTPSMMQPPTPGGLLPAGTPSMAHSMMYPQTPGYSVPPVHHIEDMPHLPPDQVTEFKHDKFKRFIFLSQTQLDIATFFLYFTNLNIQGWI